jgi:hypothetical protein
LRLEPTTFAPAQLPPVASGLVATIGFGSIVEHLQAGQKFFVQCTVALMPQLYLREGGFDNLMLSQAEIVMRGSRY